MDLLEQLEEIAKREETTVDALLSECSGVDTSALYDEMLDSCYDIIRIGTLEYYPSHVLQEVDPTAYRCGESDYIDSLISDGQYFEHDGNYYAIDEIDEIIDQYE